MTSGKIHLAARDIPKAVSELSEACEILAKEFGETSEECADAYLHYGKALLEMSRLESDVLGNALEGFDIEGEKVAEDPAQIENPDVMTVDEKRDVGDKVAEALEENFGKFDKLAKIHIGATESDEEDSMDEEESEESTAMESETTPNAQGSATAMYDLPKKASEMSIDDEANKDEEMDGEKKMDAEDASNLQLAWEMLEMAKNAFGITAARTSGDEKLAAEAKVCSAIIGLGEISLENENYEQAVEDFKVCLEKRKAVLPADSRCIAEVHYQIGMALGSMKRYTEAEASMDSAIAVLLAREGNLKKMEASEEIDKEVAELSSLVADIKETIVEHKEMSKKEAEEPSPAFSGTGDGKVASNIAVKRVDGNIAEMAKDEGSAGPATA